jgi:hypothetical protein
VIGYYLELGVWSLEFELQKKEIKNDGSLLLSRMLLAWNGKGVR